MKFRFTVVLEGIGFAIRVVPHTSREDRIVCKVEPIAAPALALLLEMLGLTTTAAWVGARFALAEVDLAAFQAAFGKLPLVVSQRGDELRTAFLQAVTLAQESILKAQGVEEDEDAEAVAKAKEELAGGTLFFAPKVKD